MDHTKAHLVKNQTLKLKIYNRILNKTLFNWPYWIAYQNAERNEMTKEIELHSSKKVYTDIESFGQCLN